MICVNLIFSGSRSVVLKKRSKKSACAVCILLSQFCVGNTLQIRNYLKIHEHRAKSWTNQQGLCVNMQCTAPCSSRFKLELSLLQKQPALTKKIRWNLKRSPNNAPETCTGRKRNPNSFRCDSKIWFFFSYSINFHCSSKSFLFNFPKFCPNQNSLAWRNFVEGWNGLSLRSPLLKSPCLLSLLRIACFQDLPLQGSSLPMSWYQGRKKLLIEATWQHDWRIFVGVECLFAGHACDTICYWGDGSIVWLWHSKI